ncbi:MAG: O-antigen ligase family protein, partial [Fulvivirga sp.]|nr:O-antigen ligase family protein [Fulvivirga sp.]
ISTYLLLSSIIAFLAGVEVVANSLIIALILCWLLDKKLGQKIKMASQRLEVWLFASYFLITVLGMVHTSDVGTGWKFIEMRLLIFLLPPVLYTSSLSKESVDQLLKAFLFTCAGVIFVGLIISYINYAKDGDTGFFFNDNLVMFFGMKAAYFAIYINICIVICFYFLQRNFSKYGWYFLLAFLIVAQLLLATRISILTLIILSAVYMTYLITRQGLKTATVMLLAVIGLGIASIFLFPQTVNRFKSMFSNFEYQFDNPNPVNHFNAEVDPDNWNGLTLRLALWDCGWQVAKKSPVVGVGTGDYDEQFKDQLIEVNFIYAQKLNFGVHNQYLYTMIAFGVVGLSVFLFSIVYPAFKAYARKNYLFLLVLFIFLMAFLTENVLNRYMGIYPFALLLPLLYFKNNGENLQS